MDWRYKCRGIRVSNASAIYTYGGGGVVKAERRGENNKTIGQKKMLNKGDKTKKKKGG